MRPGPTLEGVNEPTAAPRVWVSGPFEDGTCVVLRLAASHTLAVRFHDDNTLRDVTGWAADLLAAGLIGRSRRALGLDGAPDDTVTVADVELLAVPAGEPGADLDEAILPVVPRPAVIEAWLVSPARRAGDVIELADIFDAMSEGVALMILDAVAHEGADVPDDASSIDPT